MPAKAGIQSTNLDSRFHGNDAGRVYRPQPHQLGNQHTAAISLSSLRSFSHEAPRSSLR
jgi:hypothetical protein